MIVQNMNDSSRARLGHTPGFIRMNRSKPTVGGAHLGLYVPFSALEPNQPNTEHTMLQLVKRLNRDDALLMCGFLNCVTSGTGPSETRERQRSAYSSLFTQSDATKINAWLARQRNADRFILFFRGQMLELMRWVARYSQQERGTGKSFECIAARETFIRAAFLAADLWSARTYRNNLTGGPTQDEALDRALGAFRKGVEEAGTAMHIGVAMARGKFLFEDHMATRLPTFRSDFENSTGLTIEEYFICAGMLMMKVFDKPTDGYFFRPTYANQTTFYTKFQRFLAISAQDSDALAYGLWQNFDSFGFRAVREKPILLTSSGQCIVLDPTFFIDCFTISPVFKLLGGSHSATTIFAAFGCAFEDYALSILGRIYPEQPPLVKRLYTDVLHRKVNPAFQVDALINDATNLVIMEMKSAFIREDSLLSPDPELFLQEIRKRYAVTDNPKDRNVGVAQLAKCTRAIVVDRWNCADIEQCQLKQIFPVLVAHDERMGSPGIGAFLNRIFLELLGNVGNRVRVAPLTIMTIHDLENIESSEFNICEMLSAYTTSSDGGMISMHNFLATDTVFKEKLRPNEALKNKSFEFLDQLKNALFPDTQETEADLNNSL